MMDIITRNPSSDEVFVSPQGPKHYFVFHPLFESSRTMEEVDGEEEEDEQEEERVSTELTLAPASSTCQYPQYDHKVSTTLTLGFPSSTSFTNKREAVYIHNPSPFHYPERRQLLPPDVNISIKQEAEQEEAEEERQLPIDVNNIQHEDEDEDAEEEEEEEEEEERWKIRKTLTTGDLGSTCRFVETKSLAQKHLLLYWNAEFVERVLGSKGAGVIVRDCDTNSTHKLSLRYWKSSLSYVLNRRWGKFVRRRGLKKGNEIGLYWDTPTSRFMFSVLQRADQPTSSSSSTV